jgi:hypothetical protein
MDGGSYQNLNGTDSQNYGNNNDGNDNKPRHRIPFYMANQTPTSLRGDGYGGGGVLKYSPLAPTRDNGIQSHNYEPDESEVWRAYVAQVHFSNRGHW